MLLLVGAGCYVLARVLVAASVGPHKHPDTTGYRDYPVDLLGRSPRPWVASALMRLGDHPYLVAQAALSGASFLVLGVAIAATMRERRVQIGVVALVALLGLAPRVTTWDTMMLTESLALSFSALLIACLIHIRRVPWPATAAVFTLWLFTRDAHFYLGVIVLAVVVVWSVRARRRALPIALAAAMTWGAVAYSNDDRIEGLNVTINVAWYAGTDVDTFHWFADRGMPVTDAFGYLKFVDRWQVMYADPTFREWAETDGQRVYTEYLATHPAFLFGAVRYMFAYPPRENYTLLDHSAFQVAHTPGPPVVWPNRGSAYTAVLLLVALAGTLLIRRDRKFDRRWALPGLLVASAVPHALLAYHAAPTEIARHGALLAFTLVLAGWWLIALTVDAAMAGSHRPAGEVVHQDGDRAARPATDAGVGVGAIAGTGR